VGRLWSFAREYLLLLPFGAGVALVWANAAPESYYAAAQSLSFLVNDIAMTFFFALMMKEVVEASAPGGILHSPRRLWLPVVAATAATTLSAAVHVAIVQLFFDEPALIVVWPVAFGTDLALSYFVARLIFPRDPIVSFVLLLGIAANGLGILAIALFQPAPDLHLTEGAAIMAVAVGIALTLRRLRVTNFWPYLVFAGGASWYAFWRGGLHPALALVPIMPFLPHGARDPGFFVDARPDAKDTLSRFEIVWHYPAQFALLLFGFVNAGMTHRSIETGALALPIAMMIGRPAGVLAGAGIGVLAGLHLPRRAGWRELTVIGFAVSAGFTVALFFATALLPRGELHAEASMGALLTVFAMPLALAAARVLRVGRYRSRANRAGGGNGY